MHDFQVSVPPNKEPFRGDDFATEVTIVFQAEVKNDTADSQQVSFSLTLPYKCWQVKKATLNDLPYIEAVISQRCQRIEQKTPILKKFLAKGGRIPTTFKDNKPLIFHYIDSIAYHEEPLPKTEQAYLKLILNNGGLKQLNMINKEGFSPLLQLYLERLTAFTNAFEHAGAKPYFLETQAVYLQILYALYRALRYKNIKASKFLIERLPAGYIEKNQDILMSNFVEDLFYGTKDGRNEAILTLLMEHKVDIYAPLYGDSLHSFWGRSLVVLPHLPHFS